MATIRERRLAILAAYQAGENLTVIGNRFGLSRQRIEQIAREAGLPKREKRKRMTRAYWTSVARESVADGRRGAVRDIALRDCSWAERVQDRDACFYCGVRADLGCKHNPVKPLVPVDAGQAKGPALAEALLAAKRAGGAR